MLAACAACATPIPAAVISPLLPEPPVTGGQKRTLRLLEAMDRAGLHPHILTADPGEPGAAERLRMRGWAVEVDPEPRAGRCWTGVRQHAAAAAEPVPARARGAASRSSPPTPRSSSSSTPRARTTPRRPASRPCSACTTSTPPLARSAARQRRGMALAARAQPRRRAAGRRAARAPARRPRPVRLRGGRRRRARAPAGTRCSHPTASTTSSSLDARGRRASARCSSGTSATRRTGAASSASSPRAGPRSCAAQPGARLALAGAGMDATAVRLEHVDGVEVLGLVAGPPGRRRRGTRGGRPDLGGRRHAAEGARGAGRRPGGRVDPARRLAASASSTGGTACSARRRRELAAALAVVLADPRRAAAMGVEGRMLAERFRWPEALSRVLRRLYAHGRARLTRGHELQLQRSQADQLR